MGGIAGQLTVLGVVIPPLQSPFSYSVWIAIALVCLGAAGLIVAELRPQRARKLGGDESRTD